MGESEGQQSASIQYCTSIRTELGKRGRKRRRAREGKGGIAEEQEFESKRNRKENNKRSEEKAGQRTRGTKGKVEKQRRR